ncbi:MAG: Rieske (2Fe-2S) protein [bacterium]
MAFVSVARLQDIPESSGLRVKIDEIGIGLYRIDDKIHAMEDACPHAGFPLSEGEFENCVIVCKAHGWPFDVRTGFDPNHSDGFPVPCFAVELRGDDVLVNIEDRINDPRRKRAASSAP